jgi:hypothetical protein
VVRRRISRTELMETLWDTSVGCAMSTREKLQAVALRTDAIAVGWFHCDGVNCPARQARRPNQKFQEAFDRAMGERFGVEIDESHVSGLFDPFVVEVFDA